MNTLFNLAETFLIAALVDFYDKQVFTIVTEVWPSFNQTLKFIFDLKGGLCAHQIGLGGVL